VLVDSNGKTVVVGESPYQYIFPTMTIWRYNTDGTLDSTFGKNGIAISDDSLLIPSDFRYYGMAATLDPLGRIVVAGNAVSNTVGKTVVWRFDSSGKPDPSFHGNGVVESTDMVKSDGGNAVAIDSAGRIWVAGRYNYKLGLWRFNSNGMLDTSFGTNGLVALSDLGSANAILIDADGKVVVAGAETNHQMNIWRFSSGGGLDPTFGSNGIVTYSASCRGNAMAVDSEGKILVAGYINSIPGDGSKKMAVWRYDSSGAADATFGANGHFTNSGELDEGLGIVIDSTGKIFVAGSRVTADSLGGEMALWRINANGTSDTGFGSGGVMSWNFPNAKYATNEYSKGQSIALDPAGKIYIGGYVYYPDSDRDVVLLRVK